MKKWKHLCKAAILAGVIAMTFVQICSAAEVTTQTDTTSETGVQSADAATAPATISTNEISGWPTGPEITSPKPEHATAAGIQEISECRLWR